jgi:hypothetical protein
MYVKIKLTEKRIAALGHAGVHSLSDLYKVLAALSLKATVVIEEWRLPLEQREDVPEQGDGAE